MYQFAYTSIAEDLPPHPYPSSQRKLSHAIELLEISERCDDPSYRQHQMISDFRRLWLSITADLLRTGLTGDEACHSCRAASKGLLQLIEVRRFRAIGQWSGVSREAVL